MRANRWMLVLLSVPFSLAASAQSIPTESRSGREFQLSAEMEDALRHQVPRFTPWQIEDFSSNAVAAALADSARAGVPFALVVDANRDGRPDAILDGHDDKNTLLLALLSGPHGYMARIIRTGDAVDPKEVIHYHEGVKERGLCYFLSPVCIWTSAESFDPKKTFLFQTLFPQHSDSSGILLDDGGSISYFFEEGEFIVGDFDPL